MEIKNIDNFNLQDCNEFLKNNPDSNLVGAVKERLRQLNDEVSHSLKRDEKARKKLIHSYETEMSWIDMAQFNEKKKYKNHSTFRGIIMGIFFVCVFIIGSVIYYCNTQHYIYETDRSLQASHVTGIENVLLNWEMIQPDHYDLSPHQATYMGDDNINIPCLIGTLTILILLLSNISHSPLVNKIYNIQDGDKSQKYRAIQNKQGKMGLCKVGWFKLKKILAFDYDVIFMIRDKSYVCKRDGKVGIYNTEIGKMIIPVDYDDIYAIGDDSVELLKDNQVYSFTHKGYRIIK